MSNKIVRKDVHQNTRLPCGHEFHVILLHAVMPYKFYSKEPHECQPNNHRSNINVDRSPGNRDA